MSIKLGYLPNECMSEYLKDHLAKECFPLDGVTFVREPTGLVILWSRLVQAVQQTAEHNPALWCVNGGRLYDASAISDNDSRFVFSVPRHWHTIDAECDSGSIIGYGDEVITPLMGAIQFWCSMVDDLEYDESLADIQYQLLSAVSYNDLAKRGYDMYVPNMLTATLGRGRWVQDNSQSSKYESFIQRANAILEWEERVKEEITHMIAYF